MPTLVRISENPGSYANELNKVLIANNLPTIIIPDIPDSQKIYNITPETQTPTSPQTPQIKLRKQSKERRDYASKENESEGATSKVCEKIIMKDVWEAKDIGLQLFTTKERGWPQGKTFGYDNLKKCLEDHTYKWTYEDSTYPEEKIYDAIVDESIRLKDCWYAVDKHVFRKIRSGCIIERSPRQDRDPRLRKHSLQ